MEFLYLFIIDVLLLIIIIYFVYALIVSSLPKINKNIDAIRAFIQANDGLFTLLFIILFGLEQVILIILIYVFGSEISLLKLIVSLFSLIVMTTASLQKLLLETKRKYEREQRETAKQAKEVISEFISRRKI